MFCHKEGESSDNEADNGCNCGQCNTEEVCEESTCNQQQQFFEKTQSYADKHDFNERLVPSLETTKFEALLMILSIVMRHGMTGPLVLDLINFVNQIVGVKALPASNFIFQKLFSVDSSMTYHFVCDSCSLYLGDDKSFQADEVSCPNCAAVTNVKPSSKTEGSFFVTLSIRNQLQDLMKRAGSHLMPRNKEKSSDISDVQDGLLYQNLCREGMPLENEYALSLTISTDGGRVFETSCRNSMWPIQAVCNELEPQERFRPENMMLAALWFGETAPNMTSFFKPLSIELKELETNGIKRTLSSGREVVCPVVPIMCVCDAVAKAKIQNIKQFNGYYGCGYCLHPGHLIESQVRFPYDGTEYGLRSQQSVKEAMTLADVLDQSEQGVSGLSPLLLFPSIHLVFGVPIDYLHAVLLGITKKLIGLWFDESSTGKRYYIKKFESKVDNRLKQIVPPSNMSRRAKLICKRSNWKAKDYLNFLFYFGLPSLEGILPIVYLNNFRDLSEGIFILCKDCIKREELDQARLLLHKFLEVYNRLYGNINMVYNAHLIAHLIKIVELCGPLCMYSAFSFEGGIGLLVNLVQGTNSVASQICRKYMISKSLPFLLSFYNISSKVQKFCENILTYSRNVHSLCVNGVTMLGFEKLHCLSDHERHLLTASGYLADVSVITYDRAIFKQKAFASKDYTRPQKSNDTCVQLSCGQYGVIELIIYILRPQPECIIFFSPIRTCPGYEVADHMLTCAGNTFKEKIVLPFSRVLKKCIFFSVEGKKFVASRPNEFERD